MDIFPPKWDEIPNSHFGSHFFDSLVRILSFLSNLALNPPQAWIPEPIARPKPQRSLSTHPRFAS